MLTLLVEPQVEKYLFYFADSIYTRYYEVISPISLCSPMMAEADDDGMAVHVEPSLCNLLKCTEVGIKMKFKRKRKSFPSLIFCHFLLQTSVKSLEYPKTTAYNLWFHVSNTIMRPITFGCIPSLFSALEIQA